MTLFPLYLAICAVPAAAGLPFKPGAWYRNLDNPAWTPPDTLFPVIWAILDVSMSLAAARVAMHPGSAFALGLWSLQIAIGTLCPAAVFGLQRTEASAVILALPWLAVLATTLASLARDGIAALMTVPCPGWGSFAPALNISAMRRNPQAAQAWYPALRRQTGSWPLIHIASGRARSPAPRTIASPRVIGGCGRVVRLRSGCRPRASKERAARVARRMA